MSNTNFNRMTKAELVEYIQAMNKDGGADSDTKREIETLREQVSQLTQLNQSLVAALSSAKADKEDADDTKYTVYNTSGMAIAFTVTDPHGNSRNISLRRGTDTASLTLAQVEDLQTRFPVLFDEGHLSVPDLITPGANTIPDIDKFIQSLEHEEIRKAVNKITSLDTLFRVYNHIQNKKFEVVTDGGDQILKSIPLDSKTEATEIAVQDRIQELKGIVAHRGQSE